MIFKNWQGPLVTVSTCDLAQYPLGLDSAHKCTLQSVGIETEAYQISGRRRKPELSCQERGDFLGFLLAHSTKLDEAQRRLNKTRE